MDWESVWRIVFAAVASVGGTSVMIIFMGKWLANLSAEAIIKKKEFEFDKKLEDLKSKLEKRNYISKVRFDLEIEVYRQLSESVILMVLNSLCLFPRGSVYGHSDKKLEQERKRDLHSKAVDSYNLANQSITKNTPFIPKTMYELFTEIRDECRTQIIYFEDFHLIEDSEQYRTELKDEYRACWERTRTIDSQLTSLLEKLRNHIAELDVLEK